MAEIHIKAKGLKEAHQFMLQLPKRIEKNIEEVQKDFCSFVQKSAKLRAGRTTGALAESIKVVPSKNSISIVCDSPYAYFQEYGFRPHMIFPNMTNRNGKRLSDLGITKPVMASGFKPFMGPALEMGLNRLPMMLDKAGSDSIK